MSVGDFVNERDQEVESWLKNLYELTEAFHYVGSFLRDEVNAQQVAWGLDLVRVAAASAKVADLLSY